MQNVTRLHLTIFTVSCIAVFEVHMQGTMSEEMTAEAMANLSLATPMCFLRVVGMPAQKSRAEMILMQHLVYLVQQGFSEHYQSC